VLDLIQFCFRHIGEPRQGHYHSFFKHHHLTFDRQPGRDRFRDDVNLLFSRNGVVFELTTSGDIIQLGSPVFQQAIETSLFSTGDATLDSLLEDARRKFTNPAPKIRREGLEKLWAAWERVKTIEPAKDKKEATKKILDRAALEPTFRDLDSSLVNARSYLVSNTLSRRKEICAKDNCRFMTIIQSWMRCSIVQ
jgi:hypothetical protein